jgi:hypothetical protein
MRSSDAAALGRTLVRAGARVMDRAPIPSRPARDLAWATRVSADATDRRCREAGRTEWNRADRLWATWLRTELLRGTAP